MSHAVNAVELQAFVDGYADLIRSAVEKQAQLTLKCISGEKISVEEQADAILTSGKLKMLAELGAHFGLASPLRIQE